MTAAHHVETVLKLYHRGSGHDDADYPKSFILHLINTARALLLTRKLNKREPISEQNYTVLNLQLTSTTLVDLGYTPKYGCKFLKSTVKLPNYVTSKTLPSVKVFYADGREIGLTSLNGAKLHQSGQTPEDTIAFIFDGYLYVLTSNTKLAHVVVKVLANDPVEAKLSTNTCVGSYEDIEYEIAPDLIMPTYEMVFRLLGSSLQIPRDDQGDGIDITTSQADLSN